MKKIIAAILMIAIALTAATALTQDELDEKLGDFANEIADFMPRVATGTNYWADAHIGNLLPLNGLPHLGGGFSASAALIPTDFVHTFSSAFTTGADWETFPFPALSVDARVGGIILPFDLGVHVMTLNDFEQDFFGFTVEIPTCLSYGADVRFALLQEGVILPALSIGVGYTHSEGEFNISSENLIPNFSGTSRVKSHVEYSTDIFSASVQVSKKILFLTPFAGAKAYVQNGTYSYGGEYANIDGHTHSISTPVEFDRSFSFDNPSMDAVKWSVFAGLGVDFLIIQTTAGVSYDFTDSSWAGSVSVHLKI